MARKNRTKNSILSGILVLLTIIAGAVYGLKNQTPNSLQTQSKISTTTQNTQSETDETLIYYLDVGQGDSELIRLNTGENVLIDAGNRETADSLVDYLKELEINKIDYLIATHPHADHIGGMTQIVKKFDIGKIYMPRIPNKQVPTTKTYERLLTAIDEKGLKITAAKAGMTIMSGSDEKFEILAPDLPKYDGLNSYSVVIKLTCGEKKFLFTGDAESDSEKDMLNKKRDVKCDVLKCGHHGSSTSTSAAFLKAVKPETAIISCGVDNDYGHPSKKILSRFKKAGVEIYRTDRQNTILAKCDGKNINITKNLKSVIKK